MTQLNLISRASLRVKSIVSRLERKDRTINRSGSDDSADTHKSAFSTFFDAPNGVVRDRRLLIEERIRRSRLNPEKILPKLKSKKSSTESLEIGGEEYENEKLGDNNPESNNNDNNNSNSKSNLSGNISTDTESVKEDKDDQASVVVEMKHYKTGFSMFAQVSPIYEHRESPSRTPIPEPMEPYHAFAEQYKIEKSMSTEDRKVTSNLIETENGNGSIMNAQNEDEISVFSNGTTHTGLSYNNEQESIIPMSQLQLLSYEDAMTAAYTQHASLATMKDEIDFSIMTTFLVENGICDETTALQYGSVLVKSGIPKPEILQRRLLRDQELLLNLGLDEETSFRIISLFFTPEQIQEMNNSLEPLSIKSKYKFDILPSEVAVLYHRATQQNDEECTKYLMDLSYQGNPYAQGFLMRMYALGQGNIEKNPEQAQQLGQTVLPWLREIVANTIVKMIVASSSSSVRDIIKKIEKRSNRSVCGSTTSSFRKSTSTFRTYKSIPIPEPDKIEEDNLSDISTDSASSGSTSRGSRYTYSIPVQSIKNDIEERIRRAREQSSNILPTNLNKSNFMKLPTTYEKSNESLFSSSQVQDNDREGIRPEIVSVATFDEENKTIYTNLGTQVPETMTQVFEPESVFGDDSPYYADNRTVYSNLGTQAPETMTQVFQQQSVFGDDCPLYINQNEESPNTSDYTSKDGSSHERQRRGREGQEIIQSVLSKDEVSAITMNEAQFRTPVPFHRSASSPRSITNNSTAQRSRGEPETKTATETIGDAVIKLLSDAIINNANPPANHNLLRSKSTLSMHSTSGTKLTAIPEDLIEDEEDLERLKNFLREVGCTQGKANQYAAMLIRNGVPNIDVLTRRLQRDGVYLLQIGFDPHFAQDILELLVPDSPLLASSNTIDFNPSQQQPQAQSTPQQESDIVSLGSRTISIVDVTQPSLNLANQHQNQIYNTPQSLKSMGSIVSNNSSYYLNQSMYEHLLNGEKIRKESFIADDSSTIRSGPGTSGFNPAVAYKSDNLPSETSSIYYQAAQHRSYEACSRLIRLAENGDVFAQGFVMRMHALGQGNFPKDVTKASEIAKKIFLTLKEVVRSKSEDHACYAAYLLGVCYSEGLAQEKNMKEAIKWYKRAAHAGYDAAQAYVGFCLYAAQYNLGHCYEIGLGVPRNIIKAVEYYHDAAELNNAAAQHALACLYSTGCKEVERDVEEAYRLFKQSADQGFAEAQCKLGLVYENGKEPIKIWQIYNKP
eukprot:gene8677-9389_t